MGIALNKDNPKFNDSDKNRMDVATHISSIVRDLLLGLYSGAQPIDDKDILNLASKGLIHAVGAAIRAYKRHRKPIIVISLGRRMTGVVISIEYPEDSGVNICRVELGMLVKCNSKDALEWWPSDVPRANIAIFALNK